MRCNIILNVILRKSKQASPSPKWWIQIFNKYKKKKKNNCKTAKNTTKFEMTVRDK